MAFNGSLAVLMAAKYCNDCPLFKWREDALPNMGKRCDKFTFRVDMRNLHGEKCGEMLLSLFPAQHSFLDFQRESTVYKLKALLVTLKHPYLLPVVDIQYSKDKKGILIVQPFVASGSLKDRIFRARPVLPYAEKYRPPHASALPLGEIMRFGRQILLALSALRSKGIICQHLTAGNVMIHDQTAKLADIHNTLLAIDRSTESRVLTVPLERNVDVDVLLFGHLLYEMATGMELESCAPAQSVIELLRAEVAQVLRLVFFGHERKQSDRFSGSKSVGSEDEGESMRSTSSSDDLSPPEGGFDSLSVEENAECTRLSPDTLLQCPLFQSPNATCQYDDLFTGFRLDSSMKSTIRQSMRINATRNQAHVIQYEEQQALARAKQRAERRVYEEKEKAEQRIQSSTLTRSQSARRQKDKQTTVSKRKSLRAARQLRRQQSARASLDPNTVASA